MSEPQDKRLIDTRTPGTPAHAAPDDAMPPEMPATPEVPEPEMPPESPPVEADLQPRPEPVLEAAKLGGLVAATVVAIGGVVALIAAGRWADLNALGATIGAAVTAVVTLVAYVAPVWQARKARAKVTPLADPRDTLGRKLTALR